MKIYGLRAENVKRLKLVEIIPEGNVIKITGANGNGKTSVIDAICLALGGDAAVQLTKTTRPIHEGADSARVTVDLGDYQVTRTWKGDKTDLKVESNGKKVSSPQALLNSFLGNLSFDPLAFLNMSSADQVKTLHRLIGFDPTPIEQAIKQAYDERTLVNRTVKDLDAQLKTLPAHEDEALPEQEKQASEIMERMNAAMETVLENRKKRDELERLRSLSNAKKAELARITEELEVLKRRAEELEQQKTETFLNLNGIVGEGKELKAEVEQLKEPDIEAIKQELNMLEITNRKIRERQQHLAMKKKRDDEKAKSEALTKKISEKEDEKQAAISAAELPVEGLGFDESGVTFKGFPLDQSSHAEKLRVSMGMGMKINPELRVMFIKDGEKFDSNTWKLVEQMAIDNDYQLFVEQVDETGNIGVYLEDGLVVKQAAGTVKYDF